jgi:hypothetical protein
MMTSHMKHVPTHLAVLLGVLMELQDESLLHVSRLTGCACINTPNGGTKRVATCIINIPNATLKQFRISTQTTMIS